MKIPPRSRGALRAQAPTSVVARRLLGAQRFIHTEQNAGLALLAAALVAILWANSPWQTSYFDLLHTRIGFTIGDFSVAKDLQHWINDGLMAIFFFVVGMEVKGEIVHGELSSVRRAALPVAAALGGMVAPALLYLSLNAGTSGARGWGVPMATDIAFALGVLALVGKSVSTELRLYLLALAVADDIGAILVIAAFYTSELSFVALGVAALLAVGIFVLGRLGLRDVKAYIVLGILLWFAVLQSGVHATIAGVVLGLLTPAHPYLRLSAFPKLAEQLLSQFRSATGRGEEQEADAVLGELEELTVATEAPVERIERIIHPWSSYLVLPIFAFANAGVTLSSEALASASASPVFYGILLGLLAGKPLGIFLATLLAVRSGLTALPRGMTWKQVVGAGTLAGIGFTVAIFINDLAFDDEALVSQAKFGIFLASMVAGALGFLLLKLQAKERPGG